MTFRKDDPRVVQSRTKGLLFIVRKEGLGSLLSNDQRFVVEPKQINTIRMHSVFIITHNDTRCGLRVNSEFTDYFLVYS